MVGARRFLLYAQTLSGSGHFVRTSEIARALARRHRVLFADGGLPIPRSGLDSAVTLIGLPRLGRDEVGRLKPLDPRRTLADVLSERLRLLLSLVDEHAPDGLVIEHFPFSKQELLPEILPLIERVRANNRRARVACSVRDLVLAKRFEHRASMSVQTTFQLLRDHFDALLVHADPQFVRLEEQLPEAGQLPVPVTYTGFVSEKLGEIGELPGVTRGLVLLSSGGEAAPELFSRTLEAWRILQERSGAGERALIVFQPPCGWAGPADEGVRVLPYRTDFLRWMASADLSISRGGYNTCMNVLETRVRAIMVPHPFGWDQRERVRRLSERGLVRGLEPESLDADRLACVMEETLAGPRPEHDLDLMGAQVAAQVLDALVV